MLSHKLRRFYSRILASLSAFGVASLASSHEAKANMVGEGSATIGKAGASVNYNYYNDIKFVAAYEEQLDCTAGTRKHIQAAFASGSNCIFVCERGYGVSRIGTSTVNSTGACAATLTGTSSTDLATYKNCIKSVRAEFYTGFSGLSASDYTDYASIAANKTVQEVYGDVGKMYWYSGTTATAQYDCIPVPSVITYDCDAGTPNWFVRQILYFAIGKFMPPTRWIYICPVGIVIKIPNIILHRRRSPTSFFIPHTTCHPVT